MCFEDRDFTLLPITVNNVLENRFLTIKTPRMLWAIQTDVAGDTDRDRSVLHQSFA